jgi:hypothetical protein
MVSSRHQLGEQLDCLLGGEKASIEAVADVQNHDLSSHLIELILAPLRVAKSQSPLCEIDRGRLGQPVFRNHA